MHVTRKGKLIRFFRELDVGSKSREDITSLAEGRRCIPPLPSFGGGCLHGSSAFGDDDHANVLRLSYDSQHQVRTEQPAQRATFLWPSHEYLCHLIAMGEIDDGLSRIIAFQDSGLNVEIPGEV